MLGLTWACQGALSPAHTEAVTRKLFYFYLRKGITLSLNSLKSVFKLFPSCPVYVGCEWTALVPLCSGNASGFWVWIQCMSQGLVPNFPKWFSSTSEIFVWKADPCVYSQMYQTSQNPWDWIPEIWSQHPSVNPALGLCAPATFSLWLMPVCLH